MRSTPLPLKFQRPDGIVARAPAGIADHMGVAFRKPRVLRRIEARIHTREDREPAGRWQCELRSFSERGGVLLVGFQMTSPRPQWTRTTLVLRMPSATVSRTK